MENEKRKEKLTPITLSATDGSEYTLEFNRSSVEYAERHGFSINAMSEGQYMSGISELFFYAFRMHHPYMTRLQTDTILFEELGGLPEGMAERLGELYAEPYNALVQSEESAKNSKWTVRF